MEAVMPKIVKQEDMKRSRITFLVTEGEYDRIDRFANGMNEPALGRANRSEMIRHLVLSAVETWEASRKNT